MFIFFQEDLHGVHIDQVHPYLGVEEDADSGELPTSLQDILPRRATDVSYKMPYPREKDGTHGYNWMISTNYIIQNVQSMTEGVMEP